jgi:hypothetical protein
MQQLVGDQDAIGVAEHHGGFCGSHGDVPAFSSPKKITDRSSPNQNHANTAMAKYHVAGRAFAVHNL